VLRFVRVAGIVWLVLCLLVAMALFVMPYFIPAVWPPSAPLAVRFLLLAAYWLANVAAGGYATLASQAAPWRRLAVLGTALTAFGGILLRVEVPLLKISGGDATWLPLTRVNGVAALVISLAGLCLLFAGALTWQSGRVRRTRPVHTGKGAADQADLRGGRVRG
jgi:hypothetical protein